LSLALIPARVTAHRRSVLKYDGGWLGPLMVLMAE
jgi:hypothetical protein